MCLSVRSVGANIANWTGSPAPGSSSNFSPYWHLRVAPNWLGPQVNPSFWLAHWSLVLHGPPTAPQSRMLSPVVEVVITGVGAASPIGIGYTEVEQAFESGASGVR